MTPEQFVSKWQNVQLSERAASHEHFIDLCQMLGVETPAQSDPAGCDYCFEKSVQVIAPASKGSKGDGGFVDVWKRGHFAWEYKRKDKYANLTEAYRQLYQYRDALDNPPLSVVSDISTIEIRTHFAGFPTERISLKLEQIPGRLDLLRRLFTHPETFKPFKTRATVTAEAAKEFGGLADRLIERHCPTRHHADSQKIAHFLMKLMFCLFVEDIELLPGNTFSRLLGRCLMAPEEFAKRAGELFALMRTGGEFGNDIIPWFNGGLFDQQPALELKHGDLMVLQRIAQLDWAGVEPSIFGTLFERILDPDKRAQIGAHYTSREDILLVIEPVIMTPLKRQWAALQEELATDLKAYAELPLKKRAPAAAKLQARLDTFREGMGKLRVLDPACGSGNFLYVALQQLLQFDEQIVAFANKHGLSVRSLPWIKPTQMHGIELNPYAAELAQVVIWIGYLQWLKDRGLDIPNKPILDKLECIENRDAILDLSDPRNPAPAKWPQADFIVGNPPFLGGSQIWKGLGTEYRDKLWSAYDLPGTSDLCCYWFEQANRKLQMGECFRAGLLATQGIRGVANREVLERIGHNGNVFAAWADRDWLLDGAMVHVSIICFDSGIEPTRQLDGQSCSNINVDLTAGLDLTTALELNQNSEIAFTGTKKGGPFDIDVVTARQLLAEPTNASGFRNTEVVKRWLNGDFLNRRWQGKWIIDFGVDATLGDAGRFEAPLKYVERHVLPERANNKRERRQKTWWLHSEVAPGMRDAVRPYDRYLATLRVSKHRLFRWADRSFLPDDGVYVFARADDYFLGALQCSMHELWVRRKNSQLREAESASRYTAEKSFQTFALPWPPGKEEVKHPAYVRISEAAKELNEMRERWLNPPEWIEPLAARIDATDKFEDVPAEARPLIRQSAIMAAAAQDARLKKRTLTNLYNERPTWLKLAHEKLDRAVLAAYAATDPAGTWQEDWAEVFVDTGAGQPLPPGHALIQKRAEVEKQILENLLRLNHERADKQ